MLEIDWIDIDSMGADGDGLGQFNPNALRAFALQAQQQQAQGGSTGGTGTLVGNWLQKNLATLAKTGGQFATLFAPSRGGSSAAVAPQIILVPGAVAPPAPTPSRSAVIPAVATAVLAAVAVAIIVKKRR